MRDSRYLFKISRALSYYVILYGPTLAPVCFIFAHLDNLTEKKYCTFAGFEHGSFYLDECVQAAIGLLPRGYRKKLIYLSPGRPPCLSGSVSANHPVAPGSNTEHNINDFSIR